MTKRQQRQARRAVKEGNPNALRRSPKLRAWVNGAIRTRDAGGRVA